MHTARAVVTDGTLFARTDIVVLIGIGDSVRVTPVRTWDRLLGSAPGIGCWGRRSTTYGCACPRTVAS